MAKIDVRSKAALDFNLTLKYYAPQHLYIIKVNDNSSEQILRYGQENGSVFINSSQINTTEYQGVVNSLYTLENDQKEHHDWDNGLNRLDANGNHCEPQPTHLRTTIATGTDGEMDAIFKKMWERGQDINAHKYDYISLNSSSCTSNTSIFPRIK